MKDSEQGSFLIAMCFIHYIQKSFFQDSAGSLGDDDIVPLPFLIFTCHDPLAAKQLSDFEGLPVCYLPALTSCHQLGWRHFCVTTQ